MRTLGVMFASMFLAAGAGIADAQEPFPDPPVVVNTAAGSQFTTTAPAPTYSTQPYESTTQPIVVPVPITFNVTPNVVQRQVPYTLQVPAPVVVQQPAPVIMQQPQAPVFPALPPQPRAGGACYPIDGRAPLPFDIPTTMPGEGPITSTVLRPPGIIPDYPASPLQQTQNNPLMAQAPYQGQYQQGASYPAPAPQPQMAPAPAPQPPTLGWGPSYPAQAPTPFMPPLEPMTVPTPGVPYSLDAQGRPHYVQQPGTYQFPGPQQWPGYTPVPYNQPVQPGYAPQASVQQQQQQLQQFGYQVGQQPYQQPQADPNQAALQAIPPDLNPNLNPNLTNPNTLVQLVTPDQVKQAIMAGSPIAILDVRGELVRDVIGHIPNDISVPLAPSATFPARVRQALPNTRMPVVVYCNDGVSSSQASNMMANMGYTVYLMGVYTGWGNHLPEAVCGSCPR